MTKVGFPHMSCKPVDLATCVNNHELFDADADCDVNFFPKEHHFGGFVTEEREQSHEIFVIN